MIPYIMNYSVIWTVFFVPVINNGNRTEWSPIPSVIIWVINKTGQPHSGSPISLITSMITDRIGWHEVLLPINHNYNKICDILGFFCKLKHKKFREFFFYGSEKKKPFKCARVMVYTVQSLRHDTYCPFTLSYFICWNQDSW